MALHLNLDHHGWVYFTLSCNGCNRTFVCYDGTCSTFTSLRNAATYTGWDAGTRPEQA